MDGSGDSAALTMSDPLSAPPQPADNSSLPAVLDPLVSSRAPSLSPPSPPSSSALAARALVVVKAALAHARTPCECARACACVPVPVCPCWCLPGRAPAPTWPLTGWAVHLGLASRTHLQQLVAAARASPFMHAAHLHECLQMQRTCSDASRARRRALPSKRTQHLVSCHHHHANRQGDRERETRTQALTPIHTCALVSVEQN